MSERITTTYGELEGKRTDTARVFMGIPYAAAPVGELKMRPPAPVQPWDGVRDATQPGPTVPKPPYRVPFDQYLAEPVVEGDDCLNLNVWAPLEGTGHPVLVWIHGGAFTNGSGIVPEYDGSAFARDGVVCVTINYRLGADGFLDVGDDVTNVGIRDQIAALEWVRDNIADFGGDPSQVTVAGESAGALSIGTLLSSPKAAGLFHRAIPQSGAGHHVLPRADAQEVAKELASRLGIDCTREAFAAVPPAELWTEQAKLSTDLALAPDPVRYGQVAVNQMAWEPVVDGEVVTELPITAIRGGSAKNVDVLIGTNTHEFRFFSVPNGMIDLVSEEMLAMAMMGYQVPPDQAKEVYGADAATPGEVFEALVTDWFFRIPAIRLAEAQAEQGAKVWMYDFAWDSPVFDGRMRAAHYVEVPFVFDNLAVETLRPVLGSEPPQALADTMHAAWVSFIKTGDPGWAQYDAQRRTSMRFDTESAPVDDLFAERRQLWDDNPTRG